MEQHLNKIQRQKVKVKRGKRRSRRERRWFYFGLWLLALCFFPSEVYAFSAPIESAIRITLDNGLQVILIENHTNPLIASSVIVKAGVRNETPDLNGVSHLLEHLLFNGTSTRTQRQLYDEVDAYGAYNNASTSRDYTLFQMLVRKEYIAQILDIQADMLFNSTLPEENLDKERKIVIEEIVKDQAGTRAHASQLAEDFFNSKLYQGTSYAMPVLGTPESISTIPREKILTYYHRFYKPKNMILILMGDFETKSILEIVRKEFSLPGDKVSDSSQKSEPSPQPDLKIKDRKVYTKPLEGEGDLSQAPTYLNVALPAPQLSEPDFYAFSLLTSILSAEEHPGFRSRDLEALGARDLQLNLDFSDRFSFLVISATLPPASDPEQVLQQVLTKLDQLKAWPLPVGALEKALVKLETDEVLQSEQFHYYAFYKAPYLAAAPFEAVRNYLKNYGSVTSRAIQEVADKYFTSPPVLATLVGPRLKEEEKSVRIRQCEDLAIRECGKLPSTPPQAPPLSLKREVLDNGLTAIVKENPDTRVFAFHLLAKQRKAMEPVGKSGIAEFLHRMLLRGTKYRSAEEISVDLRSIGAVLKVTDDRSIPFDDYYFSPEYSYLRWETTANHAYEGLMQLADLIKNPALDPDQVEQVRARLLNDIREDQESPRIRGRNLFYKSLFGDHPLARPILGEEQDVKSITVEDLKAFHRAYFAPDNLILSVVSNLSAENVLGWLKFYFADLPPYSESRGQKPDLSPIEGAERSKEREGGKTEEPAKQKVEGPGEKKIIEQELRKAQSYIYLGNLFQVNEQDEMAILIMNAILSDRIAFNLREKQGLTYTIGSSVFFSENTGWFQASMGTRPENVPKAQEELVAEIKKFQTEEVPREELERTLNRLLGSLLMRRMTSINQAYFLGLQEFRNKPPDTDHRFVELAQKVTPADIQRVAKTYLDPERYVMVTVK